MEKIIKKLPILIEIQCFGNIYFWSRLIKEQQVIFEQHEHFQKSGFRNRYRVQGANGIITLSIPVVGGRETKELTREVKIDNHYAWQKNHWKTLESCYNKSPFFFHYAPGIKSLFQKKYDRLWDFDLEAFGWLVMQLKAPVSVDFTDSWQKKVDEDVAFDCRGKLKTTSEDHFINTPYLQVFNGPFKQNLSILDILFNLGPETSSYLLRQTTI